MSDQTAKALQKDWQTSARWSGVKRTYTAEDVVRLRGNVQIEHTLARLGAEKLWKLVNTEPYVNCLGALTGGQAMQQVKAGLKAIYLSGWQVAADNNGYLAMYPDQSLYPVNSVPAVVERMVVAGLPESARPADASAHSLLVNDIKNLAGGDVTSREVDPALAAAAARYRTLRQGARAALVVLVLVLALGCAAFARRRVSARFKAIQSVETAVRVIDPGFRLPGNGLVSRLDHLANAVERLDRGRLQGLYWTLR